MPRYFVALILLFLAVFATGACVGGNDDNGSESNASAVADVTADGVLQVGSDTWSATTSAHFVLEIDGDAFLDDDESIKLVSAEGDIKRPGSVAAAAKVDIAISVVDISLVAVDGDIFITNLLSGAWERAPDDFSYDPSVLFSDTDGISPIMTDLQNAELKGTADVDGRATYQIVGSVASERVKKITAGAIEGNQVTVTLWIDVEDAQLLRVVLEEPEGVRESPATWNLTLSEHNEEIEIDAPVVPTRTS